MQSKKKIFFGLSLTTMYLYMLHMFNSIYSFLINDRHLTCAKLSFEPSIAEAAAPPRFFLQRVIKFVLTVSFMIICVLKTIKKGENPTN